MQLYCESLTEYQRLKTLEVKVGDLVLGDFHPIRVQTMTTTDTMDTIATVNQTISCIEAGAELVRITAPSKKEAENLLNIKNELRKRGYNAPLVADIHFTPNAAEIAARIVEKVRVNPGNYVDKKKFEFIEYTDADYREEIDRIKERFTPLVKICKEYGTAMRIGTNHGSLSDRIMSRYGDTPMGMVESAMEFLRIARDESYKNIVLSMKSSNPLVMVQAYRLLVLTMMNEFGECYPLHLGVTEAGDGEDGRIKSAIGIGTLMEDGIGDTIRVSLTEDPEFEIPVCKDLVKRYQSRGSRVESHESGVRSREGYGMRDTGYGMRDAGYVRSVPNFGGLPTLDSRLPTPDSRLPTPDSRLPTPDSRLPYSPFEYKRRVTHEVLSMGEKHVPVVVADFMETKKLLPRDLESVGYFYDASIDKWNITDGAADFIYTGSQIPGFALPGALKLLSDFPTWLNTANNEKVYPVFQTHEFLQSTERSSSLNCVVVDANDSNENLHQLFERTASDKSVVLCVESSHDHAMPSVRRFISGLMERKITNPVILCVESLNETIDEQLIHFSTNSGALFLEGMGDGIWLWNNMNEIHTPKISGRTYLQVNNNHQFLNNTSFSILQATRTRISKTEYISCPSCGRTLFDLQETTSQIRSVTNHLKGVKIAIMGCIVNGPGEMADADFGYVGSGPGKITLYKGKEVVKRAVSSDVAVAELINLLKESNAWVEP